MAINRVVLTGRLTKDPDSRVTPSGANVVSFTIAVDGFGRDSNNNPVNQASFINCVAWNTQAKFLSTYCKKGTLVAVDGRLQTRSYDRKDGTKAYVTEVIAERVENLSPKDNSNAPVNDGSSFQSTSTENEEQEGISFSDDDLPF